MFNTFYLFIMIVGVMVIVENDLACNVEYYQ